MSSAHRQGLGKAIESQGLCFHPLIDYKFKQEMNRMLEKHGAVMVEPC